MSITSHEGRQEVDSRRQSTYAGIALGLLLVLGNGCQQDQLATTAPSTQQSLSQASPTSATLAAQGSENGAAGQMPAYYDGKLFTVNMKELPDNGSASTIGSDPSVNEIFATNDLDDEQDFFPVIDAIQGDGFNPLWRQILITFNAGFTPHQFFSDEEVEAAAAGANPEITLVVTDEVYRCSVVGRK